jgi:histidinol phosphatase-like enzyme (inositol monophosphatase family)
MAGIDLPRAARAAEAAADAARREILPRFRRVSAEIKKDGTPVTEADRAAERAIRAVLREATPEFGIVGEEYGEEGAGGGPCWIVDPIDGTISFSRGVPLFGTLIALVEGERPVLGLIDLPALGERTVGWRGGGVRRNGEPVRVSERAELADALVATGDPITLAGFGERDAWLALARDVPRLRGYTDCFGHAQVVCGAVDAMVDLSLNPWDAAATQVLVEEAGGRCVTVRRERAAYPLGLVFGSPPLVELLLGYLSPDLRGGHARSEDGVE